MDYLRHDAASDRVRELRHLYDLKLLLFYLEDHHFDERVCNAVQWAIWDLSSEIRW